MAHPGPPIRRRSDERGASLSAFVATVVVALLLMGGLVIDGGRRSSADRECQQVATEAARAATDAGAVARAAGVTPDPADLKRVAQSVLATHPGLTASVVVTGGTIQVSTRRVVPTTFLSLIGVNQLEAGGQASVALLGTP